MNKNYQTTLASLAKNYQNQDFEQGLSTAEAAEKLAAEGPNQLPVKKISKWRLFFRQFHNMIIYILLVAVVLTSLMGHYSDAAIIALVVLLNALIGYYQEANASDALAKIKNMLSKEATVFRDGQRQEIAAADLVCGDVVFLEAGDKVPADLRIVDSDNLRIQEAALTGEADGVEKSSEVILATQLPLAEQKNMAFASTAVINGSGLGVVIATGEKTELGQISLAVQQVEERKTPLMTEIDQLGKGVSYVVIFACVVLFLVGLFLQIYALPVLAIAVITMVVGSIPEGLPATTSVILALGVSEMAKKKQTIVKSLPAVETLGSVDVVATDKTGTLTKNEMTVTDLYIDQKHYQVTGEGYAPTGEILLAGQPCALDKKLRLFLEAGFEANDSLLVNVDNQWQINGEPTDGSFLTLYQKALNKNTSAYQELDLLPFDSDYRYMAKLVIEPKSQQKYIFVKGSPDKLFQMVPDLNREYWHQQVEKLSSAGKRVVAVGYQPVAKDVVNLSHEDLFNGIKFLGLAGIIDPPRPEVIDALQEMKKAGVAVKMITGDHPLTAKKIGENLGLSDEKIQVITGPQWDQLNQEEQKSAALANQVFARTTPKNKLEIISALQANQKVTAMTGDGINDAPALKKADIGVAMGLNGTDVAQDSADMVLTDDQFGTMSVAIGEGRRIYDNIKKSILFLLPTSFAEGLIIAFTILLQRRMPLEATQLLWINMVSAITIQFAFIFEPAEGDVMARPPRKTGDSLMNRHDIFQMLYVSVLLAVISLVSYDTLLDLGADAKTASTMMVNIIVVSKIFYLFNIRTREFAFSKAFFTNKKAFLIILLMLILQLGFTYLPFMQQLFSTQSLNFFEWGVTILAGALILIVTEFDKWCRWKLEKK